VRSRNKCREPLVRIFATHVQKDVPFPGLMKTIHFARHCGHGANVPTPNIAGRLARLFAQGISDRIERVPARTALMKFWLDVSKVVLSTCQA
jgi:hypothetical protein